MFEAISDKVPTMRVARALIINEHQILLARRLTGELELPGGKREGYETFARTVRREVGEETGYDIEPYGRQEQIDCSILHRRPGSPYSGFRVVTASMAQIVGGESKPQENEVSELLWVYIPEIAQIVDVLTPPTTHALGLFGLHGFGNIEIPDLVF